MQATELQLEVRAKDELARDIVGLTLVHPCGDALPTWKAGAHIDVVLGNGLVRQYSLCGDPNDAVQYRIAVLREQDGRGGSRYIHDEVQIGDTVPIRGPRNHFALIESPHYLFIAGGIGITPLLPMMNSAEVAGAGWRCFYGGRSRATMAFLDRIAAHAAQVVVCPQDECGLLDLEDILASAQGDTLVYCCGPEPLLQAVAERCEKFGWPPGSLHIERFAPARAARDRVDSPFEVYLARSGVTVPVPADMSVLDALEATGVVLPSSCLAGSCGTCEAVVLDGVPDHRDCVLDEQDRRQGKFMMTCVSRARSPRLVLDL